MKAGIAGFAGVGKSTLFQLLTGTPPDPHAALGGQVAMARVIDPRLDFLEGLFEPKKTTPASIELVDLPALVGQDRSENARRLAALREADGIIAVLGAFVGTDPVEELDRFRDEMHFADLEVTANRLHRVKGSFGKGRANVKELEAEQVLLERILATLEAGEAPASESRTAEESKRVAGFRYLTEKPLMAIVNTDDDHAGESAPEGLGPHAESLCARLELELGELEDEDERQAFMEEMGVRALARDRVIAAAYTAMGQVTFFTHASDDLRAWTVAAGSDAVTAAGKIHTDMARGFIRAEVVSFTDLQAAGDLKAARAEGHLRTEGRDYTVQDGDVIHFRFSV